MDRFHDDNFSTYLQPINIDSYSGITMSPLDKKISKLISLMEKDSGITTCRKHTHRYEFNKDTHINLIQQWGIDSSIHWRNMLYVYPNLDKFFGTPYNDPLNSELNNALTNTFSIRIDARVGYMAVLSLYNMIMIDFDVKDFFGETFTPEQRLKCIDIIKETLHRINKLAKRVDLTFVWHIASSDKGFHLFLVNQDADVRNLLWQKFMSAFCGDVLYTTFTHFHGWCVRLTKKDGRIDDYVAKPGFMHDTTKDQAIDNFFVFNNVADLQTIHVKKLKVLAFKYALISYFSEFDKVRFDYLVVFSKAKELMSIIREHMEKIWTSIPLHDISDLPSLIDYITHTHLSNPEIYHAMIAEKILDDGRIDTDSLPDD